jgi:caffeoyl-CoA O-methyltransferase
LSAGDPFDAVFIDADKESYVEYLDRSLELVRPGGLIIADNAFWSGRVLEAAPEAEGTRVMQAFNRRLAQEGLTATILPIRDGLAVAVVER